MIRIRCFTYLIIIVIKCDFILLKQIFQICWNISDSELVSPLLLMACILLMHLVRTKLDSIHISFMNTLASYLEHCGILMKTVYVASDGVHHPHGV